MNVGFLLALVHVNSVLGASQYGCASVEAFHDANLNYFSEEIKKDAKGFWLHGVMKAHGKEIGRGSFGVVRSVIGGKEDLAIKIQHPDRILRQINLEKEIILLKYLCGVPTDEDFSEFLPCEGKAIAPFKGCVEDKDEVFIIQRKALYSLEKKNAINSYRSFEPMDRLAVILKIIDNVIELHDKGIIHSDIKPANIVTRDPELQEIQLIDLGLAGLDQFEFYGGTNRFLPPESLLNHNMRKLSPQLDIYSLAITMMFLEKGFTDDYFKIHSDCFKTVLNLGCHKQVLVAVTSALSRQKDLLPLLPIIHKALSFKKGERQNSAEELSKDFVKAIRSIPRYECYFHYLVLEEESRAQEKPQNIQNTQDPHQSKIYKWLEYARELKLLVKIPTNSEPSGLASKCGDYKKPTAPPKPIQQQQLQPQLQPQQLLQKLEQQIKDLPQKHLQQLQQKQQQQINIPKVDSWTNYNLLSDTNEEKEAQIVFKENFIVHNPANTPNVQVIAEFSYEDLENDPELELEEQLDNKNPDRYQKFPNKPEFSRKIEMQNPPYAKPYILI